MLWAVAGRFGFNGSTMTMRELRFWYDGHETMSKEETAAREG